MSFDEILEDLIGGPTGLSAVIFCDDEGEMVALKQSPDDRLALFDLKVLGATAAAWLRQACQIEGCEPSEVSMRLNLPAANVLLQGLPEYYYLIAVSHTSGPSASRRRALFVASQLVAADM